MYGVELRIWILFRLW